MKPTPPTQWQNSPAAIALFDRAYADMLADGSANWQFPYAVEADLTDLCNHAYDDGGDCPISAWDKYVTAREADESRNVALAVAA